MLMSLHTWRSSSRPLRPHLHPTWLAGGTAQRETNETNFSDWGPGTTNPQEHFCFCFWGQHLRFHVYILFCGLIKAFVLWYSMNVGTLRWLVHPSPHGHFSRQVQCLSVLALQWWNKLHKMVRMLDSLANTKWRPISSDYIFVLFILQ